jgi:hypothetical protein
MLDLAASVIFEFYSLAWIALVLATKVASGGFPRSSCRVPVSTAISFVAIASIKLKDNATHRVLL